MLTPAWLIIIRFLLLVYYVFIQSTRDISIEASDIVLDCIGYSVDKSLPAKQSEGRCIVPARSLYRTLRLQRSPPVTENSRCQQRHQENCSDFVHGLGCL